MMTKSSTLLTCAGIACLAHIAVALVAPARPSLGESQDQKSVSAGQTPGRLAFGVYDPEHAFAHVPGVSIENIFVHWLLFDVGQFKAETQLAEGKGRRMLVTVEPWTNKQWTVGDRNVMKRVAEGDYDSQITAICRAAGGLARPPYMRFAAEMEDESDRYPWAGRPPKDYIAGYRHFVATCRPLAPKAAFLWSPVGRANLAAYYPGADVVDDIGLPVFSLQQADQDYYGGPQRFADALKEKYNLVIRFAKPVIVTEAGVFGDEPYRRRWLAGLLNVKPAFPQIQAVVYFNRKETGHWPPPYGSPDWRLTSAEISSLDPP
jgi:beta-mannanase